jgi:hypothetical protein
MTFPESVRKEVLSKANYLCCKCFRGPAHVHHIEPQEEGGSDEIENAAPLCPSCHAWFGGNPDLRKVIRNMRDFHYENCKKQKLDTELLEQSQTKIDKIMTNQDEQLKILGELASTFAKKFDDIQNKINTGKYPNASTAASDMIAASGTMNTVSGALISWESNKDIKKIHTCRTCNIQISVPYGHSGTVTCPRCRMVISSYWF